jgi:peptide-methionine (S)-S-oxide reductase
VFFSVAHDPTQLNRQVRTPARSIAPPSSRERRAGEIPRRISISSTKPLFDAAIVTKVQPLEGFYPAEKYHQDFLVQNPAHPYIVINDLPKVENLKRAYPDVYRPDPVLVATTGTSN